MPTRKISKQVRQHEPLILALLRSPVWKRQQPPSASIPWRPRVSGRRQSSRRAIEKREGRHTPKPWPGFLRRGSLHSA